MEPPVRITGEHSANYIRDAKVNVLRAIKPLSLEDVVIGQYIADDEGKFKGYKDDPTVNQESVTPTFATAVLYVNTPRWAGTLINIIHVHGTDSLVFFLRSARCLTPQRVV